MRTTGGCRTTSTLLTTLVLVGALAACQDQSATVESATAPATPLYQDTSRPLAERVEDLLRRLTLEQKARLVMGTGLQAGDITNNNSKVPGVAGYSYALPELGVPSIVLADGPAGLRIQPERAGVADATFYATAFPIATVLASSWDPAVLESVGAAMGEEVKEYGVDILLAPGMNIHRNPLGGRNFEYYSEDPLLSGKMAAAAVRGAQQHGVGTTLKHFVANNQETNRLQLDTVTSERALRELYMRGFEIAIKEASPAAIMSSYNKVNGTYVSQHKALLTDVLRSEWAYDGLIMSDWYAGDDPVQQLQAGNNLIMPGSADFAARIDAALATGQLDAATLDANVRHVLNAILRSPSYNQYRYSDKPDLAAHAAVARQAAAEGVVLLRNENNALPLGAQISNIALLGNTSYDFISGGTGSGDVNEAYTVSLEQALALAGYNIDAALTTIYRDHIATAKANQPPKQNFLDMLPPLPELTLATSDLQRAAASNDIGLITIGRNSGESRDRTVEADFNLTAAELQLLRESAAAFHAAGKPVVVVLNIGNVIETASWRDLVDAIVLPWQGGQEAGNALVDVLKGAINPAARLPSSFPQQYADVPSASAFPGEELSDVETIDANGFSWGKPARVSYNEGIYVGYRYYDSFQIAPAYPFGFGLSYTQFSYASAVTSSAQFTDSLTVSVAVTNSGAVAGREVVQLYLSAPAGGLEKPVHELKAFQRTAQLMPDEQQVLSFTLSPRDLASFDPAQRAWVAAAGSYRIGIGASSRDISSEVEFTLAADVVVETVTAQLAPARELLELQR